MRRPIMLKIINRLLLIPIIIVVGFSCSNKKELKPIDLSGVWDFKIDSLDLGISKRWYETSFSDTIFLPGSMTENGFGNEISVTTEWAGEILDSSWYVDDKYARYREPGNVKIPFWLQPVKHYIGVAWYQKEIEIPDAWENQPIELFLERPHWETQVWVDGKKIGTKNSLATPHTYSLGDLTPGNHRISIRIDNRINEVDPGDSSHSISDNTQTNWNGIIGKILLQAKPKIALEQVKIFPDVKNKTVSVIVEIENTSGLAQEGTVSLSVALKAEPMIQLDPLQQEMAISDKETITLTYPMGDNPLLWSEFSPNVYRMNIKLESDEGIDAKEVTFGMRDFKVQGKQFANNGIPIFLRGTLECAIFPLTGYPSTDVDEWRRIYKKIQAHGLNHMRFHSWCPPEAAFEAADELGVYLQVEASSWANSKTSKLGEGMPIDTWIYKETEQILETYGNHPSFCMMAYGNEPGGKNKDAYLNKYVAHFKEFDNRILYTGGSGWPLTPNADFYDHAGPRIQHWGAGLKSIINSKPPQTTFDYNEMVKKTPMPYVSHEMGQWCVYPNFKEMPKYTGVLKPKNFEIFKETLEENGMLKIADSFVLASGKLQALCYKADIEGALRTKDFAGFQLLDLHDFPGQGTAMVGVLDAFWDEKGYISPEEYRQFCDETVPLVRLTKRVFLNNETLKATVEVAHYGEEPLVNVTPSWQLTNLNGNVVSGGSFPSKDIPIGNGIHLGEINFNLNKFKEPQKLRLTVTVKDKKNNWDVWVYPANKEPIPRNNDVKVVTKLDATTMRYLQNGEKVLLNISKGDIAADKGGDIGVGFSSIFWNTAYTSGQKPHTLGILCNPKHAVFNDFPTEYHSNWQWWDAMSHSNAIVLDDFEKDVQPIVRIIDDWFENRRTALIFEGKVNNGKLLVSGIDLHTNLDQRIEAQQLLYSLKKYMVSEKFNPNVALDVNKLTDLFTYHKE